MLPSRKGTVLREFFAWLERAYRDESGAALVEYTVLLGILLVAVIAAILSVGTWVSSQWSALSGSLTTN